MTKKTSYRKHKNRKLFHKMITLGKPIKRRPIKYGDSERLCK